MARMNNPHSRRRFLGAVAAAVAAPFAWLSGKQASGAWDLRSVDVPVPPEALPCRLCRSRRDMYAESPQTGDWFGRGQVIRIVCACDKALSREDWCTEFETPEQALSDWNHWHGVPQPPAAQIDFEKSGAWFSGESEGDLRGGFEWHYDIPVASFDLRSHLAHRTAGKLYAGVPEMHSGHFAYDGISMEPAIDAQGNRVWRVHEQWKMRDPKWMLKFLHPDDHPRWREP